MVIDSRMFLAEKENCHQEYYQEDIKTECTLYPANILSPKLCWARAPIYYPELHQQSSSIISTPALPTRRDHRQSSPQQRNVSRFRRANQETIYYGFTFIVSSQLIQTLSIDPAGLARVCVQHVNELYFQIITALPGPGAKKRPIHLSDNNQPGIPGHCLGDPGSSPALQSSRDRQSVSDRYKMRHTLI